MGWVWQQGQNLAYLTIPEWGELGVEVGFSSREGGYSKAPFDSLNFGLHVGDDPKVVLQNRQRWLGEWSGSWQDFAVGQQVHGAEVGWLEAGSGGRGAKDVESAIPATDGLLTKSELCLMAFFADCVPIYFYHPFLKSIGIAHAGWKGTVSRIGLRVLEKFKEAGGKPEQCLIAIGPSIGPCCYEVDERVAEMFEHSFPGSNVLKPFRPKQGPKHYHLDLWEANFQVLLAGGADPEKITRVPSCTACNPERFYSYRRDRGSTGRMAGWIRFLEDREVK